MRRTPLKRSTPLKRKTGLRRKGWKSPLPADTKQSSLSRSQGLKRNASLRGSTGTIKPVSKKRGRLNRQRSKITKEMREVDPTCHIRSPICTGNFDALHEVIKRSAAGTIVPNSEKAIAQGQVFIRSCNRCNGYIEDNVLWARENGFAVSRFNNDRTINR